MLEKHRVYIAGKFESRVYLREFARTIAEMGHTVTSSWLMREELHLPQSALATEDFACIDIADLLIIDTTFPGGSGREVELGYALGKGKEVWKVGSNNNVFHQHPAVKHFSDWTGVMKAL